MIKESQHLTWIYYSKNAESQRQWNFEICKVTHIIQKPSAIKDWLFNKTIEFRGQCKDRAMDLKHWSTKNLINNKIVFQKLKPTRFQFQPWLGSSQSHSYKKNSEQIENQYFSWIHQRKESTGQTDSEIQRDRQPQNIADKA